MFSFSGASNSGAARPLSGRAVAISLLAAAALVACGGGGGSDPGGVVPPTEPPSGGGDPGTSTGPALTLGGDSFYFKPAAAHAQPAALDQVVDGGSLFAAWNPNDPNTALKPGMKVMFFGGASGCASGTEGPLTAVPSTRLGELASLTALPTNAVANGLAWTPSGNATGCDSATRARAGGSSVFLNADDQRGAVALLTTSGPQTDGQVPFLGPFGVAGQNGQGANAYITGSFVNFRQAWWKADPLQPWLGNAAARVQSQQSVATARLDASGATKVQVKQQMMATFINPSCHSELSAQGKACQVQYLFNTAIYQTQVSDWSTVDWFKNGQVWFDPAQGGIPIVDGPIYPSGQNTLEANTGRPLYTSQGSGTQHTAFTGRTFDVTVSFAQLQNVLRITTARQLGISADAVTDAQVAAQWGSRWNDRNAWALLAAYVGQEVYNPDAQRRAEIGGGFASLYVGPQ